MFIYLQSKVTSSSRNVSSSKKLFGAFESSRLSSLRKWGFSGDLFRFKREI
jgi:hypothetical protein